MAKPLKGGLKVAGLKLKCVWDRRQIAATEEYMLDKFQGMISNMHQGAAAGHTYISLSALYVSH